MQYRPLGRTSLNVSALCLGTMTWGEQNSPEEAFEQMDYAVANGINFFDTAEMYPIATRAETYGRTEEIIGDWLAARGGRDKLVLATKAVGPGGDRFPYIRDGQPRLNRQHIQQAVDDSLKRLQTDYIDLYQLHWPERTTDRFGKLGFREVADEETLPIEETLAALDEQVRAGKIRHIGLSNETAWGTMTFLKLADAGKGPRVASVQNPYGLLNRSFETGLAEVSLREDCGLLAYAPVAAGVLTGKYQGGRRPEGARLTLFPQNSRYMNPQADAAVAKYVALARAWDLDPAVMAHAYVFSRAFVTASIVGATRMEHLKLAFQGEQATLPDELLESIEQIHAEHTYPCP